MKITEKRVYCVTSRVDGSMNLFTSIAAIFDVYKEDILGVKKYRLWQNSNAIKDGEPFITAGFIISSLMLYSKKNEKARTNSK